MMKSAQGFAHIFLLLIFGIALLAGGLYWYKNKPVNPPLTPRISSPIAKLTPTTWQTYEDKSLNFKFNYPPTLSAKSDIEEDFSKRSGGDSRKNFTGYVRYEPGKFLGAVATLGSDNSYDNSPFTVWVFDNPNNLDSTAWYSKYWYYPFMWGEFNPPEKTPYAPIKEASISGQAVNYGIVSYQPGSPKYYLLKTNDQKMILIKVTNTQNGIGDQILATFQITN